MSFHCRCTMSSLNVITLNNVHIVLCNTWNISRELQDKTSWYRCIHNNFFMGCNKYVYGPLGYNRSVATQAVTDMYGNIFHAVGSVCII